MKKSLTSKKSQADWQRVEALKDQDIDFPNTPEIMPKRFARSVVRRGLKAVRKLDKDSVSE